ncbi:MAG: archaemetzincin family Zn-dependent metalloprotease [Candidatus Latescibacteria bacterium]|nr:archaemetzincin family Zn-dependent metalloprotease [Candidatus Latescibacterota bacterium]
MPSTIHLALIHHPNPEAVEFISSRISHVFKIPVKLQHASFDPRIAFDSRRQQYDSTVLLAELLKEIQNKEDKIIGLTDVDLFIPVLTFVFGEAQLNGNAAIASYYRLRNAFYGLPDNPDLVLHRLEKEVIHEMGHTFNLIHCPNYRCVMQASTSVDEIDLKTGNFCPTCLEKIRQE